MGLSKELTVADRIGRAETCPSCGADLKCCRNCAFHDERAYNQCREPQAERVLEKERSNFAIISLSGIPPAIGRAVWGRKIPAAG